MTPLPRLDLMLFLNNLIERWNEEEKCGFCWKFTAPMRESDFNEYQLNDYGKCCLVVAVTDYTFDTSRRYNNQTKLIEDKFIYHDFKLNVVTTDDLGLNVYNEIKNHDLSESKWATILKPIYDCISEDEVLTFCLDLGYIVQIERWSAVTRIDWMDNNYTGWTFNVRLKEQL
jgi:hypothetical protein